MRINIVGHTDSDGSANDNMKLSTNRAESVQNYLLQSGVNQSQILQVIGKGETNPASSNSTIEGKAQNRRVEIQIIREEP